MTRNLYLGADLGPAINATSICRGDRRRRQDRQRRRRLQLPGPGEAAREGDREGEARPARPPGGGALAGPEARPTTRPHAGDRRPLRLPEAAQKQLKATGAQVQGRRRPGRVRPGAAGRRRWQRRDRDRPARCLRRRHGRSADDARRDPRPKGSKVKSKKSDMGHFEHTYDVNLGGVLPISVTAAGSRSRRRSRANKRTRARSSASSTPTSRRSATRRSARQQARELFAKGGPLRTQEAADLRRRHQLRRPEGQGRTRLHRSR